MCRLGIRTPGARPGSNGSPRLTLVSRDARTDACVGWASAHPGRGLGADRGLRRSNFNARLRAVLGERPKSCVWTTFLGKTVASGARTSTPGCERCWAKDQSPACGPLFWARPRTFARPPYRRHPGRRRAGRRSRRRRARGGRRADVCPAAVSTPSWPTSRRPTVPTTPRSRRPPSGTHSAEASRSRSSVFVAHHLAVLRAWPRVTGSDPQRGGVEIPVVGVRGSSSRSPPGLAARDRQRPRAESDPDLFRGGHGFPLRTTGLVRVPIPSMVMGRIGPGLVPWRSRLSFADYGIGEGADSLDGDGQCAGRRCR